MSPLEKAQQLKESFNNSLTAKDCCIICVDEILEAIKSQPYGLQYLSEAGYWGEVKKLIENL
jgi:hypothetical protein